MNRDVVRLALLGSRGGWGRPLGIIVGIGVGVGLLLSLLGAAAALGERDARAAWLNTQGEWQYSGDNPPPLRAGQAAVTDGYDFYGDQTITRRTIAVAAGTELTYPWGDPPPAPGTYYASPALLDLIESVPRDQLNDRYGTFAGELPVEALASPDSLIVVVGTTEISMLSEAMATVTTDLSGTRYSENPVYRSIIIVGGIAMFVPVLLFVSIVTQLGAAQRIERLSTFRLIGASPKVTIRLAALEMALLATIGASLGIVGWISTRPIAARFRIDEGRFHVNDLILSPLTVFLVTIGAIGAATLVAAWQMGRSGIGPLGATRQQTEKPPSPVRLVPLLLGLSAMVLATRFWRNAVDTRLLEVMLILGFTVTAFGIIAIGPWLTSIGSRIAMRRAGSAAVVIAASRIRQHPAGTFRSVSGLVMAVFVASVFAGAASSVLDERELQEGNGVFALSTLSTNLRTDQRQPVLPNDLQPLLARLQAVEGVSVASVVYTDPADFGAGVISLADATALGLQGDVTAQFVEFEWTRALFQAEPIEDYAPTAISSVRNYIPIGILVGTDGRESTIERARTLLVTSPFTYGDAMTRANVADQDTRKFVNSMATLAYIGIAITVFIAGISLSVATAAAILDRKRIFGLLRLVGMPSNTLRNIVVIEAVVPLLAVVALSIGFGFMVAWLIIEGLSNDRSMQWPDGRYVLTIVSSTLLAAGAVVATLGIVRSSTTISQTRFE